MDLNVQAYVRDKPVMSIDGKPVYQWKVQVQEDRDPWTFSVVQMTKDKIYVATSLQLLQDVIDDIRSSRYTQFPNKGIWSEVQMDKPVWAVRRYRPFAIRVEDDPLSRTAKALTFSYDIRSKVAVSRYMSMEGDAGPFQRWKIEKGRSRASVRPGVYELLFYPTTPESDRIEIVSIIGLLGFRLAI
jgi:hypothetical protein